MPIDKILFILLAIIALSAGVMVITSKNTVRAVLSLVLTFIATAGLWLIIEAEFLGISLVLVYVGAVMVLFLFVVMMLDMRDSEKREGFAKQLPLAILVAALMVAQIAWIIAPKSSVPQTLTRQAEGYSNIKEIGEMMFTQYLFPFELAAILLLAAMLAAVALTFRGARQRRGQKPSEQVQVRKSDRLRIVKMASEKPQGQE
jgi:NADH-quinone oxidoreductase subunit J